MNCLIISDHPITSFGLSVIVATNFPDLKIATAKTIRDARNHLQHQSFQLILLDLDMDGNGFSLLKDLHRLCVDQPIPTITMSNSGDNETILASRNAGAHCHVVKTKDLEEIVGAIRHVISGGEYFHMENSGGQDNFTNGNFSLSERQRDVLTLVVKGYSNKKIAKSLGLTQGTIKNYMHILMRSLAVNSRLEMAVKFGYLADHNFQDNQTNMKQPAMNKKLVLAPQNQVRAGM